MGEPSPQLMWHGAEGLWELLATKKCPSRLKMWCIWRICQTGERPRPPGRYAPCYPASGSPTRRTGSIEDAPTWYMIHAVRRCPTGSVRVYGQDYGQRRIGPFFAPNLRSVAIRPGEACQIGLNANELRLWWSKPPPADQFDPLDLLCHRPVRQRGAPSCRDEQHYRALRSHAQAPVRFRRMTIPGTIDIQQRDQEQGDEQGNKMQQSDVLM